MLNKTMTVDSFAEANSKPKSEDAQTPRAENERESSANFSSGDSDDMADRKENLRPDENVKGGTQPNGGVIKSANGTRYVNNGITDSNVEVSGVVELAMGDVGLDARARLSATARIDELILNEFKPTTAWDDAAVYDVTGVFDSVIVDLVVSLLSLPIPAFSMENVSPVDSQRLTTMARDIALRLVPIWRGEGAFDAFHALTDAYVTKLIQTTVQGAVMPSNITSDLRSQLLASGLNPTEASSLVTKLRASVLTSLSLSKAMSIPYVDAVVRESLATDLDAFSQTDVNRELEDIIPTITDPNFKAQDLVTLVITRMPYATLIMGNGIVPSGFTFGEMLIALHYAEAFSQIAASDPNRTFLVGNLGSSEYTSSVTSFYNSYLQPVMDHISKFATVIVDPSGTIIIESNGAMPTWDEWTSDSRFVMAPQRSNDTYQRGPEMAADYVQMLTYVNEKLARTRSVNMTARMRLLPTYDYFVVEESSDYHNALHPSAEILEIFDNFFGWVHSCINMINTFGTIELALARSLPLVAPNLDVEQIITKSNIPTVATNYYKFFVQMLAVKVASATATFQMMIEIFAAICPSVAVRDIYAQMLRSIPGQTWKFNPYGVGTSLPIGLASGSVTMSATTCLNISRMGGLNPAQLSTVISRSFSQHKSSLTEVDHFDTLSRDFREYLTTRSGVWLALMGEWSRYIDASGAFFPLLHTFPGLRARIGVCVEADDLSIPISPSAETSFSYSLTDGTISYLRGEAIAKSGLSLPTYDPINDATKEEELNVTFSKDPGSVADATVRRDTLDLSEGAPVYGIHNIFTIGASFSFASARTIELLRDGIATGGNITLNPINEVKGDVYHMSWIPVPMSPWLRRSIFTSGVFLNRISTAGILPVALEALPQYAGLTELPIIASVDSDLGEQLLRIDPRAFGRANLAIEVIGTNVVIDKLHERSVATDYSSVFQKASEFLELSVCAFMLTTVKACLSRRLGLPRLHVATVFLPLERRSRLSILGLPPVGSTGNASVDADSAENGGLLNVVDDPSLLSDKNLAERESAGLLDGDANSERRPQDDVPSGDGDVSPSTGDTDTPVSGESEERPDIYEPLPTNPIPADSGDDVPIQ